MEALPIEEVEEVEEALAISAVVMQVETVPMGSLPVEHASNAALAAPATTVARSPIVPEPSQT